jgi:hypothetical protein
MNDRIVVALQCPVVGPPQLYLLEPATHDAASRPLALELDALVKLASIAGLPSDKPDHDPMKDFGEALFDSLNAHPAIVNSVVPLLHLNPAQGEPFYLYFEHRMHEIEQLPWEALFAPQVGFLSQNRDFAMARMLDCNSTKSEWLFEPPLKIAAVLGAGGDENEKIPADDQWASLRDAVERGTLPVQMKVLTCQIALRDKINEFATESTKRSSTLPWVTAELILDRDELFTHIREFAPHILHFFCHGTADTKPQLQLATYMDWETDTPGSIHIEGEQLKQNADLDGNIWLVTLNCCETAKNGPGTSSLSMPVACNLVGAGIPVVVGMREKIDTEFANKFCALFYRSVLEEFRRCLDEAKTQGSTNIHWACGLFQVRQSMYEKLKSSPEWTLPVMHTRLKRFQLKLNPAHSFPEVESARVPVAPSEKPGLSAHDIREYGEELVQLYEDRKIYAQLDAVVKRIDQRITEINKALIS